MKSESDLQFSPVVANNRMNRLRGFRGINSYEKDLGETLSGYIRDRISTAGSVRWLDICCGSGKALAEASAWLTAQGLADTFLIEGWDLAGMFDPMCTQAPGVTLHEDSAWNIPPGNRYDLITCVHGLHYLGDKLGMISRCAGMLSAEGIFLANLDLRDVYDEEGNCLAVDLQQLFKKAGAAYSARKKMLRFGGGINFAPPYDFAGADDTAGKNYTGQETVRSYYRKQNYSGT